LTPRHDGTEEPVDVRISQIQLEQDTAKSTYDAYSSQALIDLNRAGTALIEIISEPDMHSSAEAAAYVRKVQKILRTTGASDADMEKGSLRIDVNVSVAVESGARGTRCEIKNLNSVRSMIDAIGQRDPTVITAARS
jgi:aspartyl-tRNA(Asn)/glutamyl-tRNA(Gln) amidotransferase subunit B